MARATRSRCDSITMSSRLVRRRSRRLPTREAESKLHAQDRNKSQKHLRCVEGSNCSQIKKKKGEAVSPLLLILPHRHC